MAEFHTIHNVKSTELMLGILFVTRSGQDQSIVIGWFTHTCKLYAQQFMAFATGTS